VVMRQSSQCARRGSAFDGPAVPDDVLRRTCCADRKARSRRMLVPVPQRFPARDGQRLVLVVRAFWRQRGCARSLRCRQADHLRHGQFTLGNRQHRVSPNWTSDDGRRRNRHDLDRPWGSPNDDLITVDGIPELSLPRSRQHGHNPAPLVLRMIQSAFLLRGSLVAQCRIPPRGQVRVARLSSSRMRRTFGSKKLRGSEVKWGSKEFWS